jgi:hypothetical protein
MKPGIDANKISTGAEGAPLHNASFIEFKARLENAGVRVLIGSFSDPRRKSAPLYLEATRIGGGDDGAPPKILS